MVKGHDKCIGKDEADDEDAEVSLLNQILYLNLPYSKLVARPLLDLLAVNLHIYVVKLGWRSLRHCNCLF